MVSKPRRDPGVNLAQRRGTVKLDGVPARAQSDVVVAVDDSGQDRMSTSIDHLCVRPYVLGCFRVVADP
jgi:hypothetical protein